MPTTSYFPELDDLIRRLTEARESLPGDTPVRLTAYGRNELLGVLVGVGRVGKSDTHRLVSRGGAPVVILSEHSFSSGTSTTSYSPELDDLIHRLTQIRTFLPGSTPLRLTTHGRNELLYVFVGVAKVSKSDLTRLVSRGGTPVVVLSE